jgi:hypothetical protein
VKRVLPLLLATALSTPAAAQEAPPTAGHFTPPAQPGAPVGVVVSVDVGGGGVSGGGTQYTPSGLFEGEVGVGYELPVGLRPELGLVLGLAPHSHFALRPGVHYDLPDLPIYARGALDWSTLHGSGSWRWLLVGGGGVLRLTDVLGTFAEADLGFPLATAAGVGVLLRVGVTFQL